MSNHATRTRRLKASRAQQKAIREGYLSNVREAMVAGMKWKFPDEFTPEMEAQFRENTK